MFSRNNPSGLIRAGETRFEASVNSGQPLVGEPGNGNRGMLASGALEMSNVDLAQEFTNLIIAQLLFLEAENPDKEISLYINSPGGIVTAGMAIYDTMQYIKSDIATVCIGQAASMGAVLLAAGTHGKRYSLPNSRILIHQPMGGFQGQASDIEIQAKEILRMKDRLNHILVEHSGKSLEEIQKDTDRDFFMSGEEAKKYGIVDHVIANRDDLDHLEESES